MDEHVAHVALADLERARLVAGAVDDAGHKPVAAQAAALARAELGARLGFEGRSIGGHAAAEDREPSGPQEAQGSAGGAHAAGAALDRGRLPAGAVEDSGPGLARCS